VNGAGSVMDADSIIHLRVPDVLKARWVRASRTAGMRLTDWIVQHVEAAMSNSLPPFAALGYAREPDGDLSFDQAAIEQAASALGLPIDTEDQVCALIVVWYQIALDRGEPADPVAEDLRAEMRAEDERGAGVSHTPGRA